MWTNYLKVALRGLRRQKGHALINVLGLALGIAVCVLAGLFVRSELRFDRVHEHGDRIARAWVHEAYGPDETFTNTVTPYPLASALAAGLPDVEASVRIVPFGGAVVRGDQTVSETFLLADSAFFDVFTFPLVAGDPAAALARRDGLVLSETAAKRHFGETDPVGQPLSVRIGDVEATLTVTAVAADPPPTSSVTFTALVPFERITDLTSERRLQSWFNVHVETYVLLRPGADAATVEAKIPPLIAAAVGDNLDGGTYEVGLQPLFDIHLNTDLPAGIAPVSDPRYALILGVIALLVLLIACINFTTLAVGRSVERTREVGVRKAMGAHRRQLMGQFWTEAALMTGFAFAIGGVLAAAALPAFNDLAGRTLSLRPDAGLVLGALGLIAVVAFVAGGYPAVVLARSRPADVLRGRLRLGTGTGVQRSLVVLQFALSIALLTSALVMGQQLRFLQTQNLGYAADRVVTVPDVSSFQDGLEPLAPLLGAVAGESAVAEVSAAAFAFGGSPWGEGGYTDADGRYRSFHMNAVAPGFLGAMEVGLDAGSGFAAEPALAAQQVVVNAAFAEAFDGVAVGQPLPSPFEAYTVAGITEDFHFASLHTAVEPLMLVTDPGPLFEGLENVGFASSPDLDVIVRLAPGPLPAAMDALERAWTQAAPDRPFDFVFLDDALDQQYRAEQRLGRIVGIATALAVLIACLGLFGLAALVAAQRRKEIGVRKVLGATVPNLVGLLTRDLARLVLVGFAVAVPLAWVLMGRWLDGFAYRIDLGPGVFALAGALLLVVALATVSFHTLRAASADPVKALHYE